MSQSICENSEDLDRRNASYSMSAVGDERTSLRAKCHFDRCNTKSFMSVSIKNSTTKDKTNTNLYVVKR